MKKRLERKDHVTRVAQRLPLNRSTPLDSPISII